MESILLISKRGKEGEGFGEKKTSYQADELSRRRCSLQQDSQEPAGYCKISGKIRTYCSRIAKSPSRWMVK